MLFPPQEKGDTVGSWCRWAARHSAYLGAPEVVLGAWAGRNQHQRERLETTVRGADLNPELSLLTGTRPSCGLDPHSVPSDDFAFRPHTIFEPLEIGKTPAVLSVAGSIDHETIFPERGDRLNIGI